MPSSYCLLKQLPRFKKTSVVFLVDKYILRVALWARFFFHRWVWGRNFCQIQWRERTIKKMVGLTSSGQVEGNFFLNNWSINIPLFSLFTANMVEHQRQKLAKFILSVFHTTIQTYGISLVSHLKIFRETNRKILCLIMHDFVFSFQSSDDCLGARTHFSLPKLNLTTVVFSLLHFFPPSACLFNPVYPLFFQSSKITYKNIFPGYMKLQNTFVECLRIICYLIFTIRHVKYYFFSL